VIEIRSNNNFDSVTSFLSVFLFTHRMEGEKNEEMAVR
jgi:hypothetical protein